MKQLQSHASAMCYVFRQKATGSGTIRVLRTLMVPEQIVCSALSL